jgi:predicted metal-dependent enzyme (double-stranded beta helix superfamily)
MDIHLNLRGSPWSRRLPRGGTLDADELAGLVSTLAVQPELWQDLVRHDPCTRWYRRVALTDAIEVWLIGWWPGQRTALHDHGGASGAVAVVGGTLQETRVGPPWSLGSRLLHRGSVLRVAPSVIHQVGNVQAFPATSIHAYSPPMLEMTTYVTGLAASRTAGTALATAA